MTTLNSSGQCQKRTRPLNFGIRQAKNELKRSTSLHVTDLVSCENHTYSVPQSTGFLCSAGYLFMYATCVGLDVGHTQACQYKKHTKEYTVRIQG